jgi:hypothetical protein
MLGLGRPLDRRVLQSPFDHFVLQPIGILTNCWVRHELLLIPSIGLNLPEANANPRLTRRMPTRIVGGVWVAGPGLPASEKES